MNLKRAFVVRSRLTKHYRELEDTLVHMDIVTEKGKPYKDNPDAWFTELMDAGTMLARINAAIDKANGNSKARHNLSVQENLRRMLTIATLMASKAGGFEPVKKVYDSYMFDKENQTKGMYVDKEFELHSTTDWVKACESIKKQLRAKEDELDEINATTEVELDKDVLDYLSKI